MRHGSESRQSIPIVRSLDHRDRRGAPLHCRVPLDARYQRFHHPAGQGPSPAAISSGVRHAVPPREEDLVELGVSETELSLIGLSLPQPGGGGPLEDRLREIEFPGQRADLGACRGPPERERMSAPSVPKLGEIPQEDLGLASPCRGRGNALPGRSNRKYGSIRTLAWTFPRATRSKVTLGKQRRRSIAPPGRSAGPRHPDPERSGVTLRSRPSGTSGSPRGPGSRTPSTRDGPRASLASRALRAESIPPLSPTTTPPPPAAPA